MMKILINILSYKSSIEDVDGLSVVFTILHKKNEFSILIKNNNML